MPVLSNHLSLVDCVEMVYCHNLENPSFKFFYYQTLRYNSDVITSILIAICHCPEQKNLGFPTICDDILETARNAQISNTNCARF